MNVTSNGRVRAGVIALVAMVAMTAAACATLPPGSYPGGTVPINVTLPAQNLSYGAAGCTATLSTAPIALTGATATVPGFSVASGQTSVTIQNVTVDIPGATLDGGTASLVCGTTTVGSVSFSISFSGTASSSSATLDTATKQITLTRTTVDLTSATVSVSGGASLPLPIKTVTLPKFTIKY
jgi:hypothetical protein